MDLYESLRCRYSVRRFEPRPVEEEKLQRLLEAARLAPSARNAQEWRFVIVRAPETRARLEQAAKGQAQVGEAPVVIAACAEHDGRTMTCGQPAYPIDVAIAVSQLTLAATAEGLGTCWIGRFDEAEAKAALGMPAEDGVRIVVLLPLGYPAVSPPPRKVRLTLPEIVRYERW